MQPNISWKMALGRLAMKGGVIPRQFIPAVDKGIQEALKSGVLAGFAARGLRSAGPTSAVPGPWLSAAW